MHLRVATTLLTIGTMAGAVPARADYGDALDTGGGGIAKRYVIHAEHDLSHGHVTDALAACNRALALYPNYIDARFTCGRAAMAGADYAPAEADFTQVIAAHPEYPMVYEFRGLAYLRDKKPALAVADLNRALTAEVGMRDQMASRIFAYRSLAYQMLGQNDAAIADFQRALVPLEGHLDDYSALSLTCYTAAVVGLLDTARLACDESVARKERNIIGYEALGLLDVKQGAWDKAIADNTQSLYYRSDDPTALYCRGLAKRAKGDVPGANEDIAAATAIEPDMAHIIARLHVVEPAAKTVHG